jgi:DNA repair exonuclease SbcCD ATPase subunit
MAITPVPPASNRIRSPFSIGSQPHYEIDPDILGLLRNPRAWWANFQRQLVPVRARTLANRALIETNPRQAMLGFAQQIFGNIQSFSAQMGLLSNLFTAAGVVAHNPLITGMGLLGSSTALIVAQEEATQREVLERAIGQLVSAKTELEETNQALQQTNQALQQAIEELSGATDGLKEETRNLGESAHRFDRHLERFEEVTTSFETKLEDLNRALDRHSQLPWHNSEEQLHTLKRSADSFDPSFLLFVTIFESTQGPLIEHQQVIEAELERVLEAIAGLEQACMNIPHLGIKRVTEGLLITQQEEKMHLEETQKHLAALTITYEEDAEKIAALQENWSALANKIQQMGLS